MRERARLGLEGAGLLGRGLDRLHGSHEVVELPGQLRGALQRGHLVPHQLQRVLDQVHLTAGRLQDATDLRNHAAYDLNVPARLIPAYGKAGDFSLDAFVETDASNIIVETIKPSERSSGVVLRLFECKGSETTCGIRVSRRFKRAFIVDIFESTRRETDIVDGEITIGFHGFEIQNILLTL